MQPLDTLPALVGLMGAPVRCPAAVLPGRNPASPGGHRMQDRAVQRRVDDVVVGHEPLLLNIPNLIARPAHGYGAKREIMQ